MKQTQKRVRDRRGQTLILLRPEERERLDDAARRTGRTMTDLVSTALGYYLSSSSVKRSLLADQTKSGFVRRTRETPHELVDLGKDEVDCE